MALALFGISTCFFFVFFLSFSSVCVLIYFCCFVCVVADLPAKRWRWSRQFCSRCGQQENSTKDAEGVWWPGKDEIRTVVLRAGIENDVVVTMWQLIICPLNFKSTSLFLTWMRPSTMSIILFQEVGKDPLPNILCTLS